VGKKYKLVKKEQEEEHEKPPVTQGRKGALRDNSLTRKRNSILVRSRYRKARKLGLKAIFLTGEKKKRTEQRPEL